MPTPDTSRPVTSSSDFSPAPPGFRLAHYRLRLEALEPLHLPPLKSSALRGGFGHTFKRLVCSQPAACQKSCHRGNDCAYGYIFETSPPDDSQVLRNLSNVPRPFIIRGQQDQRLQIPAGESLSFELILIGHGISFLPYFIAIFQELGRRGLGRGRDRYRLLRVETVSPYSEEVTIIYEGDQMITPGNGSIIDSDTIVAQAHKWMSAKQDNPAREEITLNFLTPTKLKHRGRWVNQGPPFEVVVSKLLGRLSSLSYFHCGQQFETDFRGLIDRAAGVEIVSRDTGWDDWARFSSRQKKRIKMGGLVGRATYRGHLKTYLPLLLLGSHIHLGKGTVFGNGQYELL